MHGPVLAMEARRVDAPIEVEYFAETGHQLATERDGLTTHIDAAVVDRIASWLDQLRDRR